MLGGPGRPGGRLGMAADKYRRPGPPHIATEHYTPLYTLYTHPKKGVQQLDVPK